MTGADAIAQVLRDAGHAMRAAEIAREVNRRRPYQRWYAAPRPAYQVASIVHGQRRRFRIDKGLIALEARQPSSSAPASRGTDGTTTPPACVLIGCVSRKEPSARLAKELYRTELFARRRAYAEASGLPWLIVSALYDIVDPDEVIEPYDLRISDLDRHERAELGERVSESLERRFSDLAGAAFEVHAGDEYMTVLRSALGPRDARLTNPLRGLRIGEQLAWYWERGHHAARILPPYVAASLPSLSSEPLRHPALAPRITAAFQSGVFDLTLRPDAPAPGWRGMPEVAVAERVRANGASDQQVRTLLTFTAAMDRARDADALWFAAARMFESDPEALDPEQVVARPLTALADVLRGFRVSQRHRSDAAAWPVIAQLSAPPPLTDGSGTTTIIENTPPSATSPRSPASTSEPTCSGLTAARGQGIGGGGGRLAAVGRAGPGKLPPAEPGGIDGSGCRGSPSPGISTVGGGGGGGGYFGGGGGGFTMASVDNMYGVRVGRRRGRFDLRLTAGGHWRVLLAGGRDAAAAHHAAPGGGDPDQPDLLQLAGSGHGHQQEP